MKNRSVFERYLTVHRGLQPVTVSGYADAARRITRVTGLYPTTCEAELFVEQLYLSQKSYSHKTNTVLALEHYLAFIGTPTRFGRQRKPRSIVKDTLTEAEVTALLISCRTLKEKAALTLLSYSGLRNKEFCNLRTRDFDPGRNLITVYRGKMLKDGISHVSAECTRIMLSYIAEYGKRPDDFLFTTYQRKQYSTGALRKLVTVVARRANISKRVYPHLMRHSLAVNMLIRGADIVTLKNQLRHSLIESTFHYLNSIALGERNDYDRAAPSYV